MRAAIFALALLASCCGALAGPTAALPESVRKVMAEQNRERRELVGNIAAELEALSNGAVGAAIAFPPAPSVVTCVGHKPTIRALLVGADTPSNHPYGHVFTGIENDVELIASVLASRGGAGVAVTTLVGANANYDRLAEEMLGLVSESQCGDLVYFHISGYQESGWHTLRIAPSYEQLESVLGSYEVADIPGGEVIASLREEPLLINLNYAADAHHYVRRRDITNFVSALRSRGADVVATFDFPGSEAIDLVGSQIEIGDGFWKLEADQTSRTGLAAGHGEFAAFYAGYEGEKTFDTPNGEAKDYGTFSFALATALRDPATASVWDLAEALRDSADGSGQLRRRFEGSDPALTLFEPGGTRDVAMDAIQIISPALTRGPGVVETAEIEVVGTVNWIVPAAAVLVNGEEATLDSKGLFRKGVSLRDGPNTVKIVAVTSDNRLLQRNIEVTFGGDVGSLKGSGRRFVLTIGNSAYTDATGFEQLSTPGKDADTLEALLVDDFGYSSSATLPDGTPVRFSLRDATARDIGMALYHLSLVVGEADTVVIFYAGHGIYEPMTTTAFWVPVDAVAGVPPTYLSASQISEAIARIQARKVMLISDSCFSGALMRGAADATETIDSKSRVKSLLALSSSKSRLLISSGNNEPVLDGGGDGHSIFARALITGLSRMQHDQFSARELFNDFIIPSVLANAKQEPQYRPLENVGHEGGDLVFVRSPS